MHIFIHPYYYVCSPVCGAVCVCALCMQYAGASCGYEQKEWEAHLCVEYLMQITFLYFWC